MIQDANKDKNRIYETLYGIWSQLYDLKNVENAYGEVLHLVKLQVEACNLT